MSSPARGVKVDSRVKLERGSLQGIGGWASGFDQEEASHEGGGDWSSPVQVEVDGAQCYR